MNKKITLGILYLLMILIITASALALSKPIAGFVFKNNTLPAQNATVVVYVNTTFGAVNPCYTLPSVYSGSDGSFATNLANLKRNDTGGDCSGLWATGDQIWGKADGSTVINLGPQGNGNSNGDTIGSGTGLQYLSNITLGPNLLPNITLLAPPNSTVITPGIISFNYSVDDDFQIINCSLILNGAINQTNSTITKNTLQMFYASLGVGNYTWSVNCTDNSIEQSSSETRNLEISSFILGQLQSIPITPITNTNVIQNQFFNFIAQVSCLGGDCGNVLAYLDPISHVQKKTSVSSIIWNFIKYFFSGNLFTGLAAGNLVPTTPTTPFWTNSSNPANSTDFSCLANMVAGSSCNVTWFVNATGNISTTAEFFSYFNSSSYILYNETQHINITIIENNPPLVFGLIPAVNSTYNHTQTIEIAANVTDDSNISIVYANIIFPNMISQIIPLYQVGSTDKYNSSFVLPNIGGVYNITFFANDTFNNINSTESTYFDLIGVLGIFDLVQVADILNYNNIPLNHTVTVANTGNESVNASIPLPGTWTFAGGNNCNLVGVNIICSVLANGTAQYSVIDPGSADPEYTVTPFLISALNNNYTGNTVQFIKIQNKELFHTLVEYGRGRGNYFYDSGFETAGSGHTGVGCPYVPNGTLFELSFLHKVYNVNQWFGNLSAEAVNATFTCSYPNTTVVREHLLADINTNSSGVFTSYFIPTIGTSWERMGYLSMDFKEDEQYLGKNLVINCSNISYYFPIGGGYMVVDQDSFTLEIRDKEPFTASASTTDIIGNGTQEVLITYNITNTEIYTADDVIIEIQAPPYAEFIGVRGELWGSALDQYRIEKGQMSSGQSEIVQLVARFDTSNAPSITSLNLSSGIRIKYVTCWELNAYNPAEYIEELSLTGAASVDMGTASNIVSVVDLILEIETILFRVNNTLGQINQTIADIENIVDVINATTQETNMIVKAINATSYNILNKTGVLLNNTNIILNDTQFISDQLNCNGTVDTPLCDKIKVINQSASNLYNFSLNLNYTAHHLNITTIEYVNTSGINISVNVDLSNLTQILGEIKNFINCTNLTSQSNNSVCYRVERIETNTQIINDTLNSIYNTTSYFNDTVFGNFTFQQILDALNNDTVDISGILEDLQKLRDFDAEIVFLITDSFGLQQQATDEFAQGELLPSLNSLYQVNDNLKKAADKLLIQKNVLINLGEEGSRTFSVAWVLIGLVAIITVGGFIFLFRKVPPTNKTKPEKRAFSDQLESSQPFETAEKRFAGSEYKNPSVRY